MNVALIGRLHPIRVGFPGKNGVARPCTQSSCPAAQNGRQRVPAPPPGMWMMLRRVQAIHHAFGPPQGRAAATRGAIAGPPGSGIERPAQRAFANPARRRPMVADARVFCSPIAFDTFPRGEFIAPSIARLEQRPTRNAWHRCGGRCVTAATHPSVGQGGHGDLRRALCRRYQPSAMRACTASPKRAARRWLTASVRPSATWGGGMASSRNAGCSFLRLGLQQLHQRCRTTRYRRAVCDRCCFAKRCFGTGVADLPSARTVDVSASPSCTSATPSTTLLLGSRGDGWVDR